MRSDVGDDWEWSKQYTEWVKETLRANAMHLLSFEVASPEDDLLHATDMICRVKGGDVAVRIRRAGCLARDWTIRSYRASGHETELHKLQKGFASWYLYAWEDKPRCVKDWILIDMSKVRETGLLSRNWRLFVNRDGITGFIAIPIEVLKQNNCIIAGTVKEKTTNLTA